MALEHNDELHAVPEGPAEAQTLAQARRIVRGLNRRRGTGNGDPHRSTDDRSHDSEDERPAGQEMRAAAEAVIDGWLTLLLRIRALQH